MTIRTRKTRIILYKNSLIIFLFCWISWFAVSVQKSEANNRKRSEHISPEKILEFSLLSLKENLVEAKQKNEKLMFENTALRRDMNYLRQLLERLAVQKSQLTGKPLSFYYSKEQNQAADLADMADRERRSQELISHFERDVRKLEEEIQLINSKLDKKDFDTRRNLLIKGKENSRQNLSTLQKKLKSLEKNGKKPLNTIESLKTEKRVLEQEMSDLENSVYRY